MAWTKTTRKHYRRNGCATQATDRLRVDLDWPVVPEPDASGVRARWHLRAVMNAVLLPCDRLPMACFAERLPAVHDGSHY